MRTLTTTITFLAVGLALTVTLSAADSGGVFAVTNIPILQFAGWAAQTNVQVITGDFNGDGKTDVALTGRSGWNTLPIAFSNGDGTFYVTNKQIVNFAGWAAEINVKVITGDFNGDGKTDVALTGRSGWNTLPIAFSNGDGTFNVTNRQIVDFASWAAETNVEVFTGDFNGDDKTDVALTGQSGWNTLPIAFSTGDGTFNVTNEQIVDFAGWAAETNVKVFTGDFDGDGKTDVALTGQSGWNTLPIAFSNSSGTFAVTNVPILHFADWAATANANPLTGDFNGDGKTDVALIGSSGWTTLPVALSNGDATFTVTNVPISHFAGWAATANANPLTGDFNGDGKTDVALIGPSGWNTLPVAFSMSQ